MKAIETQYNGHMFRSRLEARWAVFFDSLGIQWEYEIEGFRLDSGSGYLPDFYLPDTDEWIEIKPSLGVIRDYDRERWQEFSTQIPLKVLVGSPKLPEIADDTYGPVARIKNGSFAMCYATMSDGSGGALDVRPWVWQERAKFWSDDESFLLWPVWANDVVSDREREHLEFFHVPVATLLISETKTLNMVRNPGTTKFHDTPTLIKAYETASYARFGT